jgi:hypothetical protein
MAGCKSTLSGEDFYGAYDAQDKAAEHAPELGMKTVPSLNIAYTQEKGYVTADVAKAEVGGGARGCCPGRLGLGGASARTRGQLPHARARGRG